MLQYLERFGGDANARGLGVVQYALAYVVDATVKGDMTAGQEHLGLAVLGISVCS